MGDGKGSKSNNLWNCSSLCWLKHEELHGTVTLKLELSPVCAIGGEWETLSCGAAGEKCFHLSCSFKGKNSKLEPTSVVMHIVVDRTKSKNLSFLHKDSVQNQEVSLSQQEPGTMDHTTQVMRSPTTAMMDKV